MISVSAVTLFAKRKENAEKDKMNTSYESSAKRLLTLHEAV